METIKASKTKRIYKRKPKADCRAVTNFSAPRWFTTELDRIANEAGQMRSELIRQVLTEALQIQRPQF